MPDGNQAASGGTKDTCVLVTFEKIEYMVSCVMKQDFKDIMTSGRVTASQFPTTAEQVLRSESEKEDHKSTSESKLYIVMFLRELRKTN